MNGMSALMTETAKSSLALSAKGTYNEKSAGCHLEGVSLQNWTMLAR